MDLNSLSQISQILSGIAVLAAVAFGFAQIRQFQQQRRDSAAVELMRSLQDIGFMCAFRLIYSMPEGKRAVDLRSLGSEYEEAAFILSSNFETMGFLVFRENIPFHLVEELVGGAAVKLWDKLRPWVEDLRHEQSHPMLFEWFQWLVERLNERGRSEQLPAYVQYRTKKSNG